jgi:hypothetical protein
MHTRRSVEPFDGINLVAVLTYTVYGREMLVLPE